MGRYKSSTLILKKNTLHQLLSLRSLEELLCPRCGKAILEGNLVHRTTSSFRYYHQECWESMVIDA